MLCVIRFIRDEEHGLFGVIQKAQSTTSKKHQAFQTSANWVQGHAEKKSAANKWPRC